MVPVRESAFPPQGRPATSGCISPLQGFSSGTARFRTQPRTLQHSPPSRAWGPAGAPDPEPVYPGRPTGVWLERRLLTPLAMAHLDPRCGYCGVVCPVVERDPPHRPLIPTVVHGRRICDLCEDLPDTILERRRLERWQHACRAVQRRGLFRTILEVAGLRIGRFLHPLLPDDGHPDFSFFFPGTRRLPPSP